MLRLPLPLGHAYLIIRPRASLGDTRRLGPGKGAGLQRVEWDEEDGKRMRGEMKNREEEDRWERKTANGRLNKERKKSRRKKM